MIGHTLGRYEILAELGRGTMGIVYKARDPLIERHVAVKTLRTDFPPEEHSEVRERFLREARSAGRLSHPRSSSSTTWGKARARRTSQWSCCTASR